MVTLINTPAIAFALDAAMIFASQLLRGMTSNASTVRNLSLLLTTLLGYIPVLLALYNIYTIRYHKG